MKKFLSAALIAGSLLFMPTTQAEVQSYTGNGEYYMSDFETFDVAQQRAEQNACEKAGVFVKSFSRTKNFELDEDVIETMTSGILNVVDTKMNREHFDNNTTLIRVTVYVNIDSNDVLKWLRKSETERENLVKQTEDLRRANADQERQIAELKKLLAEATAQRDKDTIAQNFAAADKIFLANQKVSEAWQRYNQKDYNGAIRLHTEALKLNPDNALAYYGRAYAYDDLKKYPQVIADCTKAVQFDSPRLVDAYNNRGIAYGNLSDYNRAFADYGKAIQLKPDYALAYYNRCRTNLKLKNYERAVDDFSKYIQLAPNDPDGYVNRGVCYRALGDAAKAQADFDKAKRLGAD